MSAKAKTKKPSTSSPAAEGTDMATAATIPPPSNGAGPIIMEAVPPSEAPPAAEPAPREALLARVRKVTGKAVVTAFSRVRAAQTTTVQKTLAWIAAADAGLSKTLVAGEQFLLARLHVTPE